MNTFTRSLLTLSAAAALSLSAAPLVTAAPTNSMMVMHYNKGTVTWYPQAGARWYNIYYKEVGDKTYTHAVRRLPSTSTSYTINYLKPNARYVYNVKAVNSSSTENWWSGEKALMTSFMK